MRRALLFTALAALASAAAPCSMAQSRTVSTADMPKPGVSYIQGPTPVRRETVSTGFLPEVPRLYGSGLRTDDRFHDNRDRDGYADDDRDIRQNDDDDDRDNGGYYVGYPGGYGGYGRYGGGRGDHGHGHGDDDGRPGHGNWPGHGNDAGHGIGQGNGQGGGYGQGGSHDHGRPPNNGTTLANGGRPGASGRPPAGSFQPPQPGRGNVGNTSNPARANGNGDRPSAQVSAPRAAAPAGAAPAGFGGGRTGGR